MELEKDYTSERDRSDYTVGKTGTYGSFLENLGCCAATYQFDRDLTLLSGNSNFYRCIGYTKEEFHTLFSSLCQYLEEVPSEFNKIREAVKTAIKNGQSSFTADCCMPAKDGSCIWLRINGTLTGETKEGEPVFLAVYTDISDLTAQKEEKRQYFEWMLDEYVGNVYVSDMDTYELLYVNQVSLDTLKSTKNKVVGKKCYEVIQGRTAPCPFCTNDKLRPDQVYQWEFFNPVLERTFMIKNKLIDWAGHKARLELSYDMYSTEYKLAKKDQERDALAKAIPGGSARLDARDYSTILWYGAEFLDLIGYTKEQFEEELQSQCTYVHPEDLERLMPLMKEMRTTGDHMTTEVRITRRTGEIRTLTLTLSYTSAEDSWDGIPSFYSLGLDVTTERREQERQRKALEDAYQAAKVANSAKTNFLSSMSHDIRTPMNAIIGMTAIAKANISSPDRVEDCLGKINVSSRHLLSLINEVLDMSKIESGKIDLLPEEIFLPQLVENISDMCKPLVAEKQQEFKINILSVRHEKIIADGDRLQQVFMNLLSNAIKYTPKGGTICFGIKESAALYDDIDRFEFIFQDNGVGMSNEFIPRIFEPFSRAEDSCISDIQGTGLGMAITENIVRMMNGSIDVKSQLGEGSKFTITLPFQLVDEELDCDRELQGLPILVVDDDEVCCENASALLNELGMKGYWVLSGEEALARALHAHQCGEDYFAIILDWKMPQMDGLATLKALRRELGKDVPIIIISAYDYSNIEEDFLQAGADAFISKPLFRSKMLHILQSLVSSGRLDTINNHQEEKKSSLFSGKHILLVEDNVLNREIATELLQMHGIIVESAENGQLALEMFKASAPKYYDAILMDIQMPIMDGYEATEAIRSLHREDAEEIPILALTANAFTTDVGKAYNVGMNEHIAKPLDIKCLLEIMEKYMVL